MAAPGSARTLFKDRPDLTPLTNYKTMRSIVRDLVDNLSEKTEPGRRLNRILRHELEEEPTRNHGEENSRNPIMEQMNMWMEKRREERLIDLKTALSDLRGHLNQFTAHLTKTVEEGQKIRLIVPDEFIDIDPSIVSQSSQSSDTRNERLEEEVMNRYNFRGMTKHLRTLYDRLSNAYDDLITAFARYHYEFYYANPAKAKIVDQWVKKFGSFGFRLKFMGLLFRTGDSYDLGIQIYIDESIDPGTETYVQKRNRLQKERAQKKKAEKEEVGMKRPADDEKEKNDDEEQEERDEKKNKEEKGKKPKTPKKSKKEKEEKDEDDEQEKEEEERRDKDDEEESDEKKEKEQDQDDDDDDVEIVSSTRKQGQNDDDEVEIVKGRPQMSWFAHPEKMCHDDVNSISADMETMSLGPVCEVCRDPAVYRLEGHDTYFCSETCAQEEWAILNTKMN